MGALAVLLAMVAAVPMGDKGEVGSLITEKVHDMDVAENKAEKYAKKAAEEQLKAQKKATETQIKAQKKAVKAQLKASEKAVKG